MPNKSIIYYLIKCMATIIICTSYIDIFSAQTLVPFYSGIGKPQHVRWWDPPYII